MGFHDDVMPHITWIDVTLLVFFIWKLLIIIVIIVIMTIRAYPYSRDPAILPLAVINNFNI